MNRVKQGRQAPQGLWTSEGDGLRGNRFGRKEAVPPSANGCYFGIQRRRLPAPFLSRRFFILLDVAAPRFIHAV